jgi:hypothetical protein
LRIEDGKTRIEDLIPVVARLYGSYLEVDRMRKEQVLTELLTEETENGRRDEIVQMIVKARKKDPAVWPGQSTIMDCLFTITAVQLQVE